MRFYLVKTRNPILEATQADAKEVSKRQSPRPAEWGPYELNTTKKDQLLIQVQELMALSYKAGQAEAPDEPQRIETTTHSDPERTFAEAPGPGPKPAGYFKEQHQQQPKAPGPVTVAHLEDFILDQASTAEIERLFSCIGARFSELNKGR